MSKVTKLYARNAAENPDNVLEQAIGNYENVFIIGWDKEGFMDVRSSTGLTIESIIFLIDKFKHKLLAGDYDEE